MPGETPQTPVSHLEGSFPGAFPWDIIDGLGCNYIEIFIACTARVRFFSGVNLKIGFRTENLLQYVHE